MKNFKAKGERLTFLESQCVKPSTRIASGDPVLVGRIAGVANGATAAATDSVVLSLTGVYELSVTSIHNGLSVGETVYIDPTTAVLSDDQSDTPFGVALGTVGSGLTALINVRLFGATPGATGAGS